MTTPVYKWQPTTAEIAATAGIAESDVERFDHNTSPVPSSWAAGIVAGASSRLNEYPAASYAPIREAAARRTGLTPEWVIPGAGADELILLAGRAFLSPHSTAVEAAPTYPLYAISTAQAGARMHSVPAAAPDFTFPGAAVATAADGADVVWLCVPNNPTGSRPTRKELRSIIDATTGTVVLDAAYAEFAADDWGGWVRDHNNLLVLHTLSKAYGLAGARVGYGLGSPRLVAALDAVRPPGSIGSLSVDLAVAALATPARMRATVADLVRARSELAGQLTSLGLRCLPSPANFVLCELGPAAHDLHAGLMSVGLVARSYPVGSSLENYLRFTVRSASAHHRLIEALRSRLS